MAANKRSTRNGAKPTSNEREKALDMKLIRAARKAPALIKREDVERFERRAQQRDIGRRLMWVILSMSGKDLIEQVRTDRVYAVNMAVVADGMQRYRESNAQLNSFVDSAEARLMVALAYRKDMDEVIAEAREQPAYSQIGQQQAVSEAA